MQAPNAPWASMFHSEEKKSNLKKNEITSLLPDSPGHDDKGAMKSLSKHKVSQDKSAE